MKDWLRLTLHHPPLAAEGVSAALFAEGATTLWEDAPDTLGRVVTVAGFDVARQGDLAARLPGLVANVAASFGLAAADFDFALNVEADQNWAETWKEGLTPIAVGPQLAVAPTWWPDDDLPRAEHILRLDPGMAFGSGRHATTFLCLSLLAPQAPRCRAMLDVGAGSGILALSVALLNPAATVVGVDNDPETVPVARENGARNGLTGPVFTDRPLAGVEGAFDLIAANITLNPLLELAGAITAKAAPGARLVLSGLLETQAAEAWAAYEKLGWQPVEHLRRDEWAALSLAAA